MKKIPLQRFFSLFLLTFFVHVSLIAAMGKGYLITKDEKFITGEILSVDHGGIDNRVIFMNDFGNLYRIPPFLIKGFVYKKEAITVKYVSKYVGDNWMFLKVEMAGGKIRLYNSVQSQIVDINNQQNIQTRKITEFWLEKEDGTPFRIYPLSFKKRMKAVIGDYPELAKKIGKKGYRFKNLKEILEEYNSWAAVHRFTI